MCERCPTPLNFKQYLCQKRKHRMWQLYLEYKSQRENDSNHSHLFALNRSTENSYNEQPCYQFYIGNLQFQFKVQRLELGRIHCLSAPAENATSKEVSGSSEKNRRTANILKSKVFLMRDFVIGISIVEIVLMWIDIHRNINGWPPIVWRVEMSVVWSMRGDKSLRFIGSVALLTSGLTWAQDRNVSYGDKYKVLAVPFSLIDSTNMSFQRKCNFGIIYQRKWNCKYLYLSPYETFLSWAHVNPEVSKHTANESEWLSPAHASNDASFPPFKQWRSRPLNVSMMSYHINTISTVEIPMTKSRTETLLISKIFSVRLFFSEAYHWLPLMIAFSAGADRQESYLAPIFELCELE